MNLTVENTAIVLDSTADLPDAADRFPNWRVVPLYVRFGDESLRDGVDIDPAEFYARLRESSVFPTTSQPTPGDFLACYRELGTYERIFSLHVSARVSGTFASAETAAAAAAVATGEITRASREVELDGLAIRRGDWLGLADGEPVVGGDDFADVASELVAHLVAEPRSLLTLLTGAEPPPLDGLVERLSASHPELEIEVHEGGQPHYPLLLGAE